MMVEVKQLRQQVKVLSFVLNTQVQAVLPTVSSAMFHYQNVTEVKGKERRRNRN